MNLFAIQHLLHHMVGEVECWEDESRIRLNSVAKTERKQERKEPRSVLLLMKSRFEVRCIVALIS